MDAREQLQILDASGKLLDRQAFYSRATALFGTLAVVVFGFGTENLTANWPYLVACEGLILTGVCYSLYERKLARKEFDNIIKKVE